MARIIKRYENRKLYDTEGSTYVAQSDVAQMVRSGETVRVVDNVTGEDLTAQVLTQIILEEGKRGDALLPTDVLHALLRRSGAAVETGLEQLRHVAHAAQRHGATDLVQQSLGRLNRLLRSPQAAPQAAEVERLREQMTRLEAQLARVLAQAEHVQAEAPPDEHVRNQNEHVPGQHVPEQNAGQGHVAPHASEGDPASKASGDNS